MAWNGREEGEGGGDMTNANQKSERASERPICSVSSLDALLDIGDGEEEQEEGARMWN